MELRSYHRSRGSTCGWERNKSCRVRREGQELFLGTRARSKAVSVYHSLAEGHSGESKALKRTSGCATLSVKVRECSRP